MTSATGKRKKNRAGLTLIEILIVVLLLGILLGIASPRMASSFSGMQLSTGSKDIAALARYAWQRAVLDEVDYRINFDQANSKYWLTYRKEPLTDPEKFQHISGSLGKIYNLPEKVKILRIIHPADSFPYITFYPDGTADETRIYLKNDNGKVYVISTSRIVGKITVEEINAG